MARALLLQRALAHDWAEQLWDSNPQPLLWLDAAGRVQRANRALQELFPELPSALAGVEILSALPAELGVPLQQLLLSTTEQAELRVPCRCGSGDTRTLRVRAHRLRASPGWLLVLDDLSELLCEQQELQREVQELRARSQQALLEAALADERERRQLAHDLHDGVGQTLALALLELKSVPVAATDPALTRALALIARVSGDVRALLYELSPPVLYDLGLLSALDWLVEDVRERWGLHVTLEHDGSDLRLSADASVIIFRAVRELLGNVREHSGVTRAQIALRGSGARELQVSVSDDGSGFDPSLTRASSSFGSASLRQRIGGLGGSVEHTSAPGRGTCVLLRVPLAGEKN